MCAIYSDISENKTGHVNYHICYINFITKFHQFILHLLNYEKNCIINNIAKEHSQSWSGIILKKAPIGLSKV